MKIICSLCETVIGGPTVGIEDSDYVVSLICKSCDDKVCDEDTLKGTAMVYALMESKNPDEATCSG